MRDKKKLHFKTNVQLKSIIGKDLINDDKIAILELVKNSFDADSKRVDVNFINLKIN
jgi:DNA mismatch repair ATPase MutL